MFCKYCGKNNDEGSKFCIYCGKAFPVSQEAKKEANEAPKEDMNKSQDAGFNFSGGNFNAIVDPIINDFKAGNSEKALKTINEYIYNENTSQELKNNLRQIKDAIEERVTKHGTPVGKAPSMYTLNGVGTRVYGDTLYFVVFFIPFFPIARYKLENHGRQYTFYGKLPLKKWQKAWIFFDAAIILLIIIFSLKA